MKTIDLLFKLLKGNNWGNTADQKWQCRGSSSTGADSLAQIAWMSVLLQPGDVFESLELISSNTQLSLEKSVFKAYLVVWSGKSETPNVVGMGLQTIGLRTGMICYLSLRGFSLEGSDKVPNSLSELSYSVSNKRQRPLLVLIFCIIQDPHSVPPSLGLLLVYQCTYVSELTDP